MQFGSTFIVDPKKLHCHDLLKKILQLKITVLDIQTQQTFKSDGSTLSGHLCASQNLLSLQLFCHEKKPFLLQNSDVGAFVAVKLRSAKCQQLLLSFLTFQTVERTVRRVPRDDQSGMTRSVCFFFFFGKGLGFQLAVQVFLVAHISSCFRMIYTPLKVSSLCLFLLPHCTVHAHPREDDYRPTRQPYR